MGYLYHGSKIQGLKIIEPHKSTHGEYVYATRERSIALYFSGLRPGDMVLDIRHNKNGLLEITERIPNSFELSFNISSSIYTIDDSTFSNRLTGFNERMSTQPVKVIKEEHIDNLYEELKKLDKESKIKLNIYPNKPQTVEKDDSDLITKTLKYYEISKEPIARIRFKRLLFFHPGLLEKLNKKLRELKVDFEFSKEDLINIYKERIYYQIKDPNKEYYIDSALTMLSNSYPELLNDIKEEINTLRNNKYIRKK